MSMVDRHVLSAGRSSTAREHRRGRAADGHQPGHGRGRRPRSPAAARPTSTRAVRAAHAAFADWSALASPSAARSSARPPRHVEAHVDELDPAARRRAGQDDPRGADRAAQGGRHARALRGPGEGSCAARTCTGSTRASTGACCAGRSASSARSCRGTSRRRCCATSSARRCVCRQHGRRQAGRHDAADDAAPRRDPRRGAGCPPGVFNVVTGDRRRGRRGARHAPARAQGRVHRLDADRRARHGAAPRKGAKRVTLELGGSDPMIICDDADLAAAASAASMGRFYNCGQACLAIKRVYVFESVADEVIEAIARQGAAAARRASATRRGLQMGPLHTERQRDDARAPDRADAAGGGEVAGRRRARRTTRELADGWFHEPTVVVDPPHDSPMAREEVFGPALPIWRVRGPRRGDRAAPTTRRSASARRSGRATSTAPSARPPSSTAATRGSTRRTKVYDELPFGGLKAQRLRQGARLRGARLLHRHEVGGGPAEAERHVRALQREPSRRPPRRGRAARDKPAFIAPDATLTYERAAPRRSTAPGSLLRALGVGREHRVLLVLDDTTAFPIAFLGAMRIGAVPGAGQPRSTRPTTSATTSRTPTRRVVLTDAADAAAAARGARRPRRCATSCAAATATTSSSSTPALAAQERRARRRRRRTATTWRSGSTARARPASRRASCTSSTTSRSRARPTRARCSGCARTTSTFSTTKLFHAYGLGNGALVPAVVVRRGRQQGQPRRFSGCPTTLRWCR